MLSGLINVDLHTLSRVLIRCNYFTADIISLPELAPYWSFGFIKPPMINTPSTLRGVRACTLPVCRTHPDLDLKLPEHRMFVKTLRYVHFDSESCSFDEIHRSSEVSAHSSPVTMLHSTVPTSFGLRSLRPSSVSSYLLWLSLRTPSVCPNISLMTDVESR